MNSNNAKPESDPSTGRVRYLTASELYQINDEVTGGDTYVRDLHLLNSAAVRPTLVLFGEAQFPTIIDKAAALLHSVAYHHLFADGNKRTALRAVTKFLHLNGCRLTWDHATEYDLILEIAQGKYDAAQIAARLTGYVTSDETAAP